MSKKQTVKNPSVQVKDWPQFIKNYNRYGEKRRQAGLQELGSMLDHIDSVAVMPDPEKTPGGPTIVVVRGNNGEIIVYIFYGPFVKKVVVENAEVNLTVPAADKEALAFLEIPDQARYKIFEDTSTLEYKVGITENEFKYLTQLFQLNKESCRVCFSISDDVVTVSEIESTDENVRGIVNGLLTDGNIQEFDAFDKLYSKKLNYDSFEKFSEEGYLHCFNKTFFVWIDSDEHYDIEFHSNKIKFISIDEKGTKTYVVLTPVHFA